MLELFVINISGIHVNMTGHINDVSFVFEIYILIQIVVTHHFSFIFISIQLEKMAKKHQSLEPCQLSVCLRELMTW